MTPRRFRIGGYGIDASSTIALRSALVRATAKVDTYTNGALHPSKFDWRGGSVTGEQHSWQVPDPLLTDAGSRRVYPIGTPVRSCTGFIISFTENYRIELNTATDLFINSGSGYIEVIASQPTIIGFPPVGYWFGLYQPVVTLDYSYGYRFDVTDDVCEADSPLVYWASYGQWLAGGTVTIKVAGVTIDPSDYTLDLNDGRITFAASAEPVPDEEVTASYAYTCPPAVAEATALIAVDELGRSRIAQRGMIGLASIKVAEVSLTQMNPGSYTTRNGVSIPESAATLLSGFTRKSIGLP
jgi:hypothetical protein